MLKKSRVTLAVALALPIVLTGCLATGGGSFNVEKVAATKVLENPLDKKNEEVKASYKVDKVDVHEKGDYAGYWIEMPSKDRLDNVHNNQINDTYIPVKIGQQASDVDKSKTEAFSGHILNGDGFYNSLYVREDDPVMGTEFSEYADYPFLPYPLDYDLEKKALHGFTWWHGFKDVFIGRVSRSIDDKFVNRMFYYGRLGPSELPTKGEVTYNGFFDVVIPYRDNQAIGDKNLGSYTLFGNDDGVYGNIIKTSVKLDVNFEKREINANFDGQYASRLKVNDESNAFVDKASKDSPDYKAPDFIKLTSKTPWKIQGSQFKGELEGSTKIQSDTAKENVKAKAEGSFFGTAGKEIAGHFYTVNETSNADGNLAGVFGASTNVDFSTPDYARNAIFYAGIMSVDSKKQKYEGGQLVDVKTGEQIDPDKVVETVTDVKMYSPAGRGKLYSTDDQPDMSLIVKIMGTEKDQKKTFYTSFMNKYSGRGEAVSDKRFAMFQHFSFGREFGDNNRGHYFALWGTAASGLPTQGTSDYRGSWYGEGMSFSNKGDLEANYQVDWASKKLTGNLWGPGQSQQIHGNDGFGTLAANVNDNQFSGKVTFKNLRLAADRNGEVPKHSDEFDVKGGFFGKEANELAGMGGSNQFRVLFAGKALEVKKPADNAEQPH